MLGAAVLGALMAATYVEVAIEDDGPLFEVEASGANFLESAIGETQHHSALEAALLQLRRLNVGHYHRATPYCTLDDKPCNLQVIRHQVSNRGAAFRFLRDALSLIGGSAIDHRSWSWNEAAVSFLEEMDRHTGEGHYTRAITRLTNNETFGHSVIDVLADMILDDPLASNEEDAVIASAIQSEADFVRAFKAALLEVNHLKSLNLARTGAKATANATCEPKIAMLLDEFDIAHYHSMESIAHLFDSSGARIRADELRRYFYGPYANAAVETSIYPCFVAGALALDADILVMPSAATKWVASFHLCSQTEGAPEFSFREATREALGPAYDLLDEYDVLFTPEVILLPPSSRPQARLLNPMEHEFSEDPELYARASGALSEHGYCPVVLMGQGAVDSALSLSYLLYCYQDAAFLRSFVPKTQPPFGKCSVFRADDTHHGSYFITPCKGRVLIDPRGLLVDGAASDDAVMWDYCMPPGSAYSVYTFRHAMETIGLQAIFSHQLGEKRPTMAEWYAFLGSATYVISLSHEQYSAGQIILEAAVMSIPVFSLAQRHHQRVFMPEFCFVHSPYETFMKIHLLHCESTDSDGGCVPGARYRELQSAIAKNVQLYNSAPSSRSLEMLLWHSARGHGIPVGSLQGCMFPRPGYPTRSLIERNR
jgi:hypothetical protein